MKAKLLKDQEGQVFHVLGTEITVKVDAEETDGALEFVVIDAVRGSDVPPHRHPWAETYYMISGEIEVQVGARSNVLRAGDFVTIPARAVHALTVVSDEVRFLHVSLGHGATAMFGAFDKDFPNIPTSEELGRLIEVAPSLGIELLVPEPA